MPARHSETSAGTSDDSETPGDRGPGRHISEGSETRQRITVVSNPQHWANRISLALPPSWKHAMLSNRDARELPSCLAPSMCILVAKANRFKVEPRWTCELSSRLTTRKREQSQHGTVVSDPIDDVQLVLHHTR